MNKGYWKFSIIFATITVFSLLLSIPIIYFNADTETSEINDLAYEPTTTVVPLNNKIAIEKTILYFHAPEEPSHYWGYVEGTIANHVPDFAVVIQMINEEETFPRYGQVDVNENGYYEYKFRVKNTQDGELVWKMEGDYRITIFKVVHLDPKSNFL